MAMTWQDNAASKAQKQGAEGEQFQGAGHVYFPLIERRRLFSQRELLA